MMQEATDTPMRLGFVGTGAITDAIVRGVLRSSLQVTQILVSPRSASIAAGLAQASPLVTIASDNQSVVDGSDTVFLAIRPQVAEEVVKPLSFRPGQEVVSLVAAVHLATLAGWVREEVHLTRAIPLPFVADLEGVTAIYPPNKRIASIFRALGGAIEAGTAAEYDLLGVCSALMGVYFGFLETATRWAEERGMPYGDAKAYLAHLSASLSRAAITSQSSFEELRLAYSTAGGVNEQVFEDFSRNGGTQALTQALSAVLVRFQGN